jgi:hypothetical protein
VDVDEAKLKKILNENPDTDAGVIIANLLIERQVEKTKTRQANSGNSKDVEGNEGW